MNQLYIGVDGGGTHTRVAVADNQGRILGHAQAGSTNRNHYPRETVNQNLRTALLQASNGQPIEGTIFLGLCGVSNDADRADILSIAREIPEIDPQTKIIVDNDAVIGLAAGLSGRPGMVLIAGTGSACMGIDANGQSYWCGGWGALADDAGSAPWIGTKAIQAAVRSEDGREPPSTLRDIVFNFLELKHPRELIDRVHNRGLSREDLGTLAPHIIAAAATDIAAAEIVRTAIAELSLMVATTARFLFSPSPGTPGEGRGAGNSREVPLAESATSTSRLSTSSAFENNPHPTPPPEYQGRETAGSHELILVGGLALSGPPFQPMLIEKIQHDSPHVKVRDPEMPPVRGAVLKAMLADGLNVTPEILQRLREGK